jgi:hypothetical protein
MSTAASTAAAPLRPHRQREQNQAKRRYGQPAPHIHIIAQFDPSRSGEKPGSYHRIALQNSTLHLLLGGAAVYRCDNWRIFGIGFSR